MVRDRLWLFPWLSPCWRRVGERGASPTLPHEGLGDGVDEGYRDVGAERGVVDVLRIGLENRGAGGLGDGVRTEADTAVDDERLVNAQYAGGSLGDGHAAEGVRPVVVAVIAPGVTM